MKEAIKTGLGPANRLVVARQREYPVWSWERGWFWQVRYEIFWKLEGERRR